MIADLKRRLDQELEGLVTELTERIPEQLGEEYGHDDYRAIVARQQRIESRISFLHGTRRALEALEPGLLPAEGAGFGSRVRLRELTSGADVEYTLTTGEAIDLEAGEISLASPVGSALLGRTAGDVVEVSTPIGQRRFRVVSVSTLHDGLTAPDAH